MATNESPAPAATGSGAEHRRARQHDGRKDSAAEACSQVHRAWAARRDWIVRNDRFDWCADETVVVPEQRGIAVYTNSQGAVVVRQERAPDDRDDPFVVIQPEHARTVATAILAKAGGAPRDDGPTAAALRQRRRRNKLRDRHASDRDSDRDRRAVASQPDEEMLPLVAADDP